MPGSAVDAERSRGHLRRKTRARLLRGALRGFRVRGSLSTESVASLNGSFVLEVSYIERRRIASALTRFSTSASPENRPVMGMSVPSCNSSIDIQS